jgi:NADH-quinone oxidoreductase subunit L
MRSLICIGLFLPLISFLILMATSNVIGRRAAAALACSAIGIAFACFLSLLAMYGGLIDAKFTLFQWIPAIGADFSLHLDPLSLLMTLIITGVGLLIHIYSIGYMEHEEDVVRFFACMNFFVFAMLLLVLAGNLLLLFVGWEGVGLASYLLIGFWYTRPSAAQAATKAFVMNRIGDVGFLVGLLLTFHTFGTADITHINAQAGNLFIAGAPIITLITLLYFIGATGKSAQLPLYTWLPDAMEGPTPVSALIHAATMVTAGVYLLVRLHPLFLLAPITLQVVGIVGAMTALLASLCALAQTDLKRVLAYSTVSQLGLMFVACGAGAFYSAMFHLTTHAFIKALLFLSAGNVLHMLHGKTDMRDMGGLSKSLRVTNWLFLIGVLALSGIPPLAAFFSKDLILEQEYLAGYEFLFWISLAASILTAVYLTRAYCLTFLGKAKNPPTQDAPNVMLAPVSLLALLSLIGGFLGFTFSHLPLLEQFLSNVELTPAEEQLNSGFVFTPETWLAVVGSVAGVILTAIVYIRFSDHLRPAFALLRNNFYVNEIYDKLFVQPLKAIAYFIGYTIEPKVFDQSIQVTSSAAQGTAYALQHMQSGQIRSYVAWMAIGAALLMIYFVF